MSWPWKVCFCIRSCGVMLSKLTRFFTVLSESFKAAREEQLAKANGLPVATALGCLGAPLPCRADEGMGLYESRSWSHFAALERLVLSDQDRQVGSTHMPGVIFCNVSHATCIVGCYYRTRVQQCTSTACGEQDGAMVGRW
jgi:hypothetical protein